jgi:hypothetical protein
LKQKVASPEIALNEITLSDPPVKLLPQNVPLENPSALPPVYWAKEKMGKHKNATNNQLCTLALDFIFKK